MKSMYFESQYLYDMSRLFYLRSILRNCWSRDFFLILAGAGGGAGHALPVKVGLGGPNKRLYVCVCVCVCVCVERISERLLAPLVSNPSV
jgi:hypothetical protein